MLFHQLSLFNKYCYHSFLIIAFTYLSIVEFSFGYSTQSKCILERWQCENSTDVPGIESIEGASPGNSDQEIEKAEVEDCLWICFGLTAHPDTCSSSHGYSYQGCLQTRSKVFSSQSNVNVKSVQREFDWRGNGSEYKSFLESLPQVHDLLMPQGSWRLVNSAWPAIYPQTPWGSGEVRWRRLGRATRDGLGSGFSPASGNIIHFKPVTNPISLSRP